MTDAHPYRRIVDDIRRAIEEGELRPGDRVPSIPELGRTYNVAKTTAERVHAALRAEGLVVSRKGAGVYVRTFQTIVRSSPNRLARSRWGAGNAIQDADTAPRPRTVDVQVGEIPAPRWLAEPLGVEVGDLIVYRSRRFVVDDRSVQLATSYVTVEVAADVPEIKHTDTGPGGMYARMAERGHEPTHFVERVRSRMPLAEEIATLELPPGTPVMEITRRAITSDDRCVEVNRMIVDATVYELDYHFNA
ncbi:GntR family transcriptional regulator [Cryptosporangium aurantiacum]|uniref:Transcriptional regulator, GntR family n=1 Tax=Cryptosporangium aurantiacum TaxID=134849 RepID=A0A1M7RPI0_9ACTN|nr:GntR family transcriptional regulator [Cryptosporangium aurantiacum]SHN48195.1 transcriptional regulator, GntR family [Cryptosporangium aurantiacum]